MSESTQENIRNNTSIRIGIMGGKGSFNEIAIETFLTTHASNEKYGNESFYQKRLDTDIEIVYLYTTERVLKALNSREIDYGIFAIANSIGGLVKETINSLGKYRWERVAEIHIPIKHAYMIHPSADAESIDTIMGHDQAIRQCKETLSTLYPQIQLVPGSLDLTDNAAIAEALSAGNLPKTTGCIGHASLAHIYGLQVMAHDVQDRDDNETTFLLVK